jgi:hypothetical protein
MALQRNGMYASAPWEYVIASSRICGNRRYRMGHMFESQTLPLLDILSSCSMGRCILSSSSYSVPP